MRAMTPILASCVASQMGCAFLLSLVSGDCPNGRLDESEACDDGNAIDGDACESDCSLPVCGNRIVDLLEECDDGDTNSGDGCSADCVIERCGDGIINNNGEACDDGNAIDGDACESDCTLPRCGNLIVDADETCDDGDLESDDGCSDSCQIERCGDNITQSIEACDDGNPSNGDGCNASCTVPACNNGVEDATELCLSPFDTLTTSRETHAISAGDFNNDGLPDMVAAVFSLVGGDQVAIFLNEGGGLFSPAQEFVTGVVPTDIVVADFNHDGDLDVATNNQNNDTISVLLGNGDGTLRPQQQFGTGAAPVKIVAADLNEDQDVDLITTDIFSNNLSLFLGDGQGGFTRSVLPTLPLPQHTAIADLDEDGHLDLVVSIRDLHVIEVFKGNGDATFQTSITFPTGGVTTREIAIADFNADTHLDIANTNTVSNNITLFIGDGTIGGFAGVLLDSVANPVHLIAGDIDGDADIDLLSGGFDQNNIVRILNDGDGNFTPFFQSLNGEPSDLTLVDVTQDGLLDLGVSKRAQRQIDVSQGTTIGEFISRRISFVSSFAVKDRELVGADMNRDGHMDLVLSDSEQGVLRLLFGSGVGTFTLRQSIVGPLPSGLEVGVADFNEDGAQDVFLTSISEGRVAILLNDGAGFLLSPPSSLINMQQPDLRESIAADFNGDGHLDIATARGDARDIGVSLGGGDGTFAAPYFVSASGAPGDSMLGVASADFDGDGALDLAGITLQGSLVLSSGDGAGGFSSPTSLGGLAPGTAQVAVLRVEPSGPVDIVVSNLFTDQIALFSGLGGGAFSSPVFFDAGAGAFRISVADLDTDGTSDLIVANRDTDILTIFFNNGAGELLEGVAIETISGAEGVAIEDFNEDGTPDLIVVGLFADTLDVLLSSPR